ncbi:MAG: hypothetical protein QW518_04190 [Thermofilaceae archaeon]
MTAHQIQFGTLRAVVVDVLVEGAGLGAVIVGGQTVGETAIVGLTAMDTPGADGARPEGPYTSAKAVMYPEI